jgi:hypothetical protein
LNHAVLNTEVQEFISKNLNEKLDKLVFKKSPFAEVSIREIIQQIEGKLKAKGKLPSWFNSENIYYPPKINIEQTSSEITAQYKSKIVSGKSLADLTGGFGIDSYYFSKYFEEVTHFEINKTLSEIVTHNFLQLDTTIKCINADGIEAIKHNLFDCIYIDPSRRHDDKGKVFLLSDCEPNVVQHLEYLLERCKSFLIKTSPMLDISAGLKELIYVSEIHIVAIENEVKELLWLINGISEKPLKIITVNITKTKNEVFEAFYRSEEILEYSMPKQFLYEPNAALMKSGMFQAIAESYQIQKLAVNTHLFTSDKPIDFPGRGFEIQKIVPYKKAELKKNLSGINANITTRNFPESVDTLKSKWKIKDGGDNYLFFTTDKNKNKIVLFCRKI